MHEREERELLLLIDCSAVLGVEKRRAGADLLGGERAVSLSRSDQQADETRALSIL